MLAIRSDQLTSLNPKAPWEIAAFLFHFALEHHAKAVAHMPDEDLAACVKSAMARAAKYGIEDVEAVTFFFGLMLQFAPNFDEHPDIRRILTRGDLAKAQLLPTVAEETTNETWQEVIDKFNAAAWNFGLS